MLTGTLYALAAGLMWGLAFIVPVLLPDYPASLLAFGRYLAFGLLALPIAWLDRHSLGQLQRADWIDALKLSALGNIAYYVCLAAAIQHAGAPLPTMIIGTLPVVIAIAANQRNAVRDGQLPWLKLAPSLVLIVAGIGFVNRDEFARIHGATPADLGRYAAGALLAMAATALWTWYPLRNADWLRHHPDRRPMTWSTAQGLATLPLALIGYGCTWLFMHVTVANTPMPFGQTPALFLSLMFALGLLASWAGTLCWNEASQRLPTRVAGQLIVFETMAALAYAFALRGKAPPWGTAIGVLCLAIGVVLAVRIKPAVVAEAA
jgi:drug/metabolite transporter (DMT)-like permease